MKLLLILILIITNCCFISANNLFVNFIGSYNTHTCGGSSIGTGFSISLNQCLQIQGVVSYATNSNSLATNWMAILGGDGNSFTLKEFKGEDKTCKEDPINSLKYDSFDKCVTLPSFLSGNNTINPDSQIYTQLTLSLNGPSYAPNSVIFNSYDNNSTSVCNLDSQNYGISYSTGTAVYSENGVSMYVLCDETNKPILFKCSGGECSETFLDTDCQTQPGDTQIYCN